MPDLIRHPRGREVIVEGCLAREMGLVKLGASRWTAPRSKVTPAAAADEADKNEPELDIR